MDKKIELTYEELRLLLAQSACFTTMAIREDRYVGAFVIADKILIQDKDVIEHASRIGNLKQNILKFIE